MDFLLNPYGETKVKAYLKMAVQRIQMSNNKRINAVKIQKKKISELLAEHKDEKARIQVEHIIRDDFTIEGYEVLELMCELVHERIRQITTSSKDPPVDLKEAIASLIWAARNVDIEEMRNVRQQLKQKYSPEFIKSSETNENNLVNPRLYAKLTYKPPSQYLVIKYLEEIAQREQEEANRLRQAGATYSVPVPTAAAKPATLSDAVASNPHIGMPAIPFNPQKSARAAAATPATVPLAQAVPVQDDEDYEDMLRDVDAFERKYAHTVAPATSIDAEAAYNAVDPAPAVSFLAEHLDAQHDQHQPVSQPPPPVPSAEDPLATLQARLAALNNPSGSNGGSS
eukprot:gene9096-6540_t